MFNLPTDQPAIKVMVIAGKRNIFFLEVTGLLKA